MFLFRTINVLKQPRKAKIATLQIISTYKSPFQLSSATLLQEERGCVNYTVFFFFNPPTRLYAVGQLVSWYFEPSYPQWITSGLNTNFTLSPSYSFHKSSYHKSFGFFNLFIVHGHSTREPASNRVTYFILRAYTGTVVSHSPHRKTLGEVLEKMQVNRLEGRNDKQGRNSLQ